jgi:hypothetical protein
MTILPYIFDEKSGCRERLYLLSVLKNFADSANYAYSPHQDTWHHVSGNALKVRYEASKSLEILASRGIDRPTALAMVGYPEVKQ